MAFYRLSQTARSLSHLRHRRSSLSSADTYLHSPLPSNPSISVDSSRNSCDLFQVSRIYHSKNQLLSGSNSFRSIGAYHHLPQHSSFSSVAPDEKREEPKNSIGNGGDRSWIDVYLPGKARPYARLARIDKPIGTWLLAWPCMW